MHDVDQQLMAAARALVPGLPDHTVWTTQPPGHRKAVLFTSINLTEDARRRTFHPVPEAYYRPDDTDLLLTLPGGIPVPMANLTPAQQSTARRQAAGAVHIDTTQGKPGTVTRLAVKPATVHLALVEGRANAATLGRVTSYAPFCTRALLTRVRPSTNFLIEAGFYGVGVALQTPEGIEVLVKPVPWVLRRHSPAGWCFVEHAYLAATLVPKRADP
ncbi:hypothetical protein KCMC57_64320 (plasmid) [Kitasatospora sp. CMC57]|uniref:Uncharacterized protein n=1 Tax=Kitasatospora sp. CMC57 TaxID=3231513 RepID=A0AB33K9B1_9ACTN